MATKLEKNLVRESTVMVDDREILVTLTADQEVSMKLKGMRTGDVSIGIDKLWHQLNGTETSNADMKGPVVIKTTQSKSSAKNPMISLNDLRTYNANAIMDYPTKVKFEAIIKSLMDNYTEKYGKYKKP
jgi:hypothetical protein